MITDCVALNLGNIRLVLSEKLCCRFRCPSHRDSQIVACSPQNTGAVPGNPYTSHTSYRSQHAPDSRQIAGLRPGPPADPVLPLPARGERAIRAKRMARGRGTVCSRNSFREYQGKLLPSAAFGRGSEGSKWIIFANDRESQILDVYIPMYTHRLYAHTTQSMHIPRNSTGVLARTCKHVRLLVKYCCVDTCRVFGETRGNAS